MARNKTKGWAGTLADTQIKYDTICGNGVNGEYIQNQQTYGYAAFLYRKQAVANEEYIIYGKIYLARMQLLYSDSSVCTYSSTCTFLYNKR